MGKPEIIFFTNIQLPGTESTLKMEYIQPSKGITPRIIIHGGAGNITPSNLPPSEYRQFHTSLLTILSQTHHFLLSPSSFPLSTQSSTSVIDAATFAVTLLENNPLFNSGHGAVFTREKDFFPQETCGAVALDADGAVCAATST